MRVDVAGVVRAHFLVGLAANDGRHRAFRLVPIFQVARRVRIPIESSTSYRGRNSRPNWLILAASIGAALAACAIQLLLNALWAPVFFGAGNIGAGLFVTVALWLSIAWTIREFSAVKAAAAWMMAPYLIWVGFASALNLAIWKMNP